MINFKTFESLGNPSASPESIYEPQGLLNRTASVKVWAKVGIGYTSSVERGVFAVDYIKKGECFEVAPIIVVPAEEVKGTTIMDYAFKLNNDQYAIAFGSASLYNHQNQPMAEWKIDEEKKTISFYAIRDIKPSEEIFVSYGKAYWNTREISAKVSPKLKQTQK
jgi:SET domain-containing protein